MSSRLKDSMPFSAPAESDDSLAPAAEPREAYYRGLFESSAEAILVANSHGCYTDANQAAAALLGYETHELIRMSVTDIVIAAPEWADSEFRSFMEAGSWRGEVELRHKSGRVIPAEAWATTLQLESGPIGVSALRDISERRRLRDLQQDFLAMVSHELLNPLTPIIGFAQILLRQQTFNAEAVQEILDQSLALQRLVGDLLDTASFRAGHFTLERSECDLMALAKMSIERARLIANGHTVLVEGPHGPITGLWDRDRLRQVFDNLVANAMKYSPDGGEIRLTVSPGPKDVTILLRDHGLGLMAEDIARVFEPFSRAQSAKGAGRGVGLGLYVVKMLIEAHGGEITAESDGPQKGCEFRIRLPYR